MEITLVERTATFSYFIPTAIRLMRADGLPAAQAADMASWWLEHFRFVWRRASALRLRSPEGLRHYSQVETALALNKVRAALALIGWLAALRALSLPMASS